MALVRASKNAGIQRYIEASSLKHEYTEAVPIQTSRKLYTRPAGPPLTTESEIWPGPWIQNGVLLETNVEDAFLVSSVKGGSEGPRLHQDALPGDEDCATEAQ